MYLLCIYFQENIFSFWYPHETASCLLLNSALHKKVEANGMWYSGILVMLPLGSKTQGGIWVMVVVVVMLKIFRD